MDLVVCGEFVFAEELHVPVLNEEDLIESTARQYALDVINCQLECLVLSSKGRANLLVARMVLLGEISRERLSNSGVRSYLAPFLTEDDDQLELLGTVRVSEQAPEVPFSSIHLVTPMFRCEHPEWEEYARSVQCSYDQAIRDEDYLDASMYAVALACRSDRAIEIFRALGVTIEEYDCAHHDYCTSRCNSDWD
jgi:hypothetical protein